MHFRALLYRKQWPAGCEPVLTTGATESVTYSVSDPDPDPDPLPSSIRPCLRQ